MLNEQRKRFVEKCVELGNHTQAYLAVYKSAKPSTARANAHRLMENEEVRTYYDELIELERAKGIADVDEVLRTFTKVLRREISDYTSVDGEVVEIPVKAAEMLRAGEALLKRLDIKKKDEGVSDSSGVILMPEVIEE